MSKSDELKTEAQQILDDGIEDELNRMRSEVYDTCVTCGLPVTEYDIAYGEWGGEWRAEDCHHVVCLSGRLAVSA